MTDLNAEENAISEDVRDWINTQVAYMHSYMSKEIISMGLPNSISLTLVSLLLRDLCDNLEDMDLSEIEAEKIKLADNGSLVLCAHIGNIIIRCDRVAPSKDKNIADHLH